MNLPTIIVLLVLVCVVGFVIRNMIKNKKIGGCSSCGGSCSGNCACGCNSERTQKK